MTGNVVPVAGEPCANCNAPLHGKFCSECGQRYEPHVHSFAELASEAFESVTHADSRLWRTLWLLISKPGFLTKEFVEGRRARYLPPFRLYLVVSVALFLVFALANHEPHLVAVQSKSSANIQLNDLTIVRIPERGANETPSEQARKTCDEAKFGVPDSWVPRLREGCRKVVIDNGHSLAEAMVHNIPRALFALIPLLALVMRAMYWRRYYVEHLLFFIHNHSFTFVLFAVCLALGLATGWAWLIVFLIFTVLFYPPYYTYKAMRLVYAQPRGLTMLKWIGLSVAYLFFILLLGVFTSVYSLVTL